MVGLGRRARLDDAAPAPDDGRHRRTVVRGHERRPAFQCSLCAEDAQDRGDRRDLHRLVLVQRREHPGQALGQHRLARPRGADEIEMVASGRRGLQRPARFVLPDDVHQVGDSRPGRGRHGRRRRLGHRVRRQPLRQQLIPSDQLAQVLHRVDLHVPDQPRLGRVGHRDDDVTHSRPCRRQDQWEHPAHWAHGAVQPQLTDVHDLVRHPRRDLAGGHQRGDADPQVESRPDLGHRRRREVHRHPARQDGVARVRRGRLDPVGRLRAGRVGPTADRERRQAARDVHLDVDEEADQSLQAHRPGASQRHDATATRCSIWQAPRRGRSTPMTSTRTSA